MAIETPTTDKRMREFLDERRQMSYNCEGKDDG